MSHTRNMIIYVCVFKVNSKEAHIKEKIKNATVHKFA